MVDLFHLLTLPNTIAAMVRNYNTGPSIIPVPSSSIYPPSTLPLILQTLQFQGICLQTRGI